MVRDFIRLGRLKWPIDSACCAQDMASPLPRFAFWLSG